MIDHTHNSIAELVKQWSEDELLGYFKDWSHKRSEVLKDQSGSIGEVFRN